MKSAAFFATIAILLAAVFFSEAKSAEPIIREQWQGAGLLRQCGDQLRSWILKPTDARWRETAGYPGSFEFACLVEPSAQELGLLAKYPDYVASQRKPCPDEPTISGGFILPEDPRAPAQEEVAILYSALPSAFPRSAAPPLPAPACPAFDVSVGGLAGRATCAKEGTTSAIIARFEHERLAFAVIFSQQDKPLDALREKVATILSRQFTIERGTGDASLLRWTRP